MLIHSPYIMEEKNSPRWVDAKILEGFREISKYFCIL
jgi:hypothetical protein